MSVLSADTCGLNPLGEPMMLFDKQALVLIDALSLVKLSGLWL